MSSSWPVDVASIAGDDASGGGHSVAVGSLVWRHHGALHVTLIAKATFDFAQDGPLLVRSPDDLVVRDRHHHKDPAHSVHEASDLVPLRKEADVTFVGHAYGPSGGPTAATVVRLAVYRDAKILDRTLQVVGDRDPSGRMMPFVRMALTRERAMLNADNPYGSKLPNVFDPKDPMSVGSFAPVSRYSASRATLLRGMDHPAFDNLDRDVSIPDDFDWGYCQSAPIELRVSYLRGDEWIVLDGVHPTLARWKMQLPSVRASARIRTERGLDRGVPRTLDLALDSLAIDGDALTCSATFRASFAVDSELVLPALHISMGMASASRALHWPVEPEAPEPVEPARVHPGFLDEGDLEQTFTLSEDDSRALLGRPVSPFVPVAPGASQPPPRSVMPALDDDDDDVGHTRVLTLGEARQAIAKAAAPFPIASDSTAPPARAPEAASAPSSEYPIRATPAIPMYSATPLMVVALPWSMRPPIDSLTVFIKGTFDLIQDGAAKLRDESDLPDGDIHFDKKPEASVAYPSDFAVWKPKADVVLNGHAYAPHGAAAQMQVTFRFGKGTNKLDRSLLVQGDRYWKRAALIAVTPSDPIQFNRIPLIWERAFGGPKLNANPLGVGYAEIERGLPNIEDPSAPIAGPGDTPAPVCFAPIPMTWPERWSRLGTYDDTWLATRWPYFPADFDWSFFQSAPTKQQLEYLDGDEPYEISGVHPELPTVRGTLPGMRVRCFAQRTAAAGNEFSEISVRLDTAAFDSDAMKVNLVWRGRLEVSDDEAPELAALFTMTEPLDKKPTTLEEARRLFIAIASPREPIETEPEAETPANDAKPEAPEAPEVVELEKQIEERRKSLAGAMSAAGIDSETAADPPLRPTPEAMAASMRAMGIAEEEVQSMLDAMKPDPSGPPPVIDMRARVMTMLAGGASLDGLDAQAADLSELDFSDRSLVGANLKDANCSAARFERANLSGAQLGSANLEGASLNLANLTGADLTGARVEKASFVGAIVEGATFENASGRASIWTGAKGAGASFANGDWKGALFDRVDLQGVDFSGAKIDEVVFEHALLNEIRLYGAVGRGARFDSATMNEARVDDAILPSCSMNQIVAPGSVWETADLTQASFIHAKLAGAGFSRAQCEGAIFNGAELSEGRFRRAKLIDAHFLKANLMMATFERADATRADFRGSNLHASETWKAKLEGAKLDLAIVTKSKLGARK